MIGQPMHVINDSPHVLTCLLSLIANCSLIFQSSKLFMINAILMLYVADENDR